MSNPLQFVDDQNRPHVEPSVTTVMTLQTQENAPPELPTDLYVLGTFRDSAPLTLIRTKTLAEAISAFDAEQSGDQGVELIKVAKAGVADPNMFGAGDVIGVRVNAATQSTSTISESATELLTLSTVKYGNATRRWRRQVSAGTTLAGSKKIRVWNDYQSYQIDNLGPVMSIQYTGDGSAATLSILRSGAILTYTGQPADADTVQVETASGVDVTFEFDTAVDPGAITAGNVRVVVGADADETYANLITAIEANCAGVAAVQNTVAGTVTLSAPDDGVAVTEIASNVTAAASGSPAALRTTLTGATDGSVDLTIPLTMPSVNTIAKLVAFIGQQLGYTVSVRPEYVNNGFIASSALDVVSGTDIATAAVDLTAYVEVIANAINAYTGGLVTCAVVARGEPDTDAAPVWFTGGTTPAAVAGDWEDALNLLGSNVQTAGVILLDTDDAAIFAMAQQFVVDQQGLGKRWRVYCGAQAGLTTNQYAQIVGGLNDSHVRLVVQRMQRIGTDGTITTVDPVYFAAALAGAACGNKPYVNPLTNKQLRFVAIAPTDDFTLTTRESLLSTGITVAKSELGLGSLAVPVVSLHVSTSLSDRRMARIVSETDTALLIDATVREAFLDYRGKWSNEQIISRAPGTMLAVLDRFRKDGAIVPGYDQSGNAIPAYVLGTPAATIYQGVLKLSYTVYIAGELDHVALRGDAEYTRLVASLSSGGTVTLTTSIQL